MKSRIFAIIAITCFAALCARADNYSFKEPFTKDVPFNANGVLNLENVNGSVDIRAWDKNEIRIEGEKSAETEEELKQIEMKMDVSASSANIKVHLPKRNHSWFGGGSIRAAVRFTITLPAGASVEHLSIVNSQVTVDGLHGNVDVQSVNGRIHATNLSGDVRLDTVNGGIDATISAVTKGQTLSFKTVNGSVTARLPADSGAAVHAATVNGGIKTDFPLTVSGAFVGHNLDGTIGDGRASFSANTVNGRIEIKRI